MVACRNLAIVKTEKRISLMGEIIRYIRIIKINGWEDVFNKKVNGNIFKKNQAKVKFKNFDKKKKCKYENQDMLNR